ncbi:ATP-dependent acyl-CoA ligase [Nocardioides gansuensis]|uniref:ATP-dependent acyl-CoA ligase n=1 Tax=Nocardioides gansuensis TaxID=2138300 RepID=A0A2T8F4F3_9ACTN|nr:AMP-binding protein [Nocardioides gansuensis]PVG80588.1 ATP-dependent acyl-CoA ligase [Nocardioides gansuensis]
MDWWSPDVPPAETCVLGPVLLQHLRERPDAVYALFPDGTQWTYRDVWAAANTTARELQELGVSHGDRVLSWLPNGPDAIRVWFGANLLGAIYVPLNTAYRGGLLEHAIRLSEASVLLASPGLIERLGGLDVEGLRHVIAVEPIGELDHDQLPVTPDQDVQPWDPYAIIMTSGTTGPSKGVVCSYVQLATAAAVTFDDNFGPDDRYMINLPLFHVAGTICTYGALLCGGSISIVESFDTASFWDTIRATGTTHAMLMGVMASFLAKQPPSDRDRDHPLRRAGMVPVIDDVPGFSERFGVEIVTMFNMTEISVPLVSEANPTARGTCGKLRRGVHGRLVDEHDREVPTGEVGELILRTERPWAMNSGYWGMPDATARAWRNGWFHTGDAFRLDADGNYFFVDRMKDAIRRRGENISSVEVEAEILAHPAVREAAVVAVPSPHGEDDVLAVVAPVDGVDIDPAELLAALVDRLSHFMVPRYIRIMPELPRTSTNKIEKYLLRKEGVTADTWDRERAGIQVKAERFTHR